LPKLDRDLHKYIVKSLKTSQSCDVGGLQLADALLAVASNMWSQKPPLGARICRLYTLKTKHNSKHRALIGFNA
jgi:hypothetical protein